MLGLFLTTTMPTGRRYLTSYPVVIDQTIFVQKSWSLKSDDVSDWPPPEQNSWLRPCSAHMCVTVRFSQPRT